MSISSPSARFSSSLDASGSRLGNVLDNGRAGSLRIGFGIASVSEILRRIILRFRKLYPDVELQMREMPSPSQVSSLIEGRLDAGILRLPVSNPKLISVPLFSEHLLLATPAHAPYRLQKGIGGFRNSGFIFVSPSVSETFRDRVLSLCLRAGFTPRVVQEANETVEKLGSEQILFRLTSPCCATERCREEHRR